MPHISRHTINRGDILLPITRVLASITRLAEYPSRAWATTRRVFGPRALGYPGVIRVATVKWVSGYPPKMAVNTREYSGRVGGYPFKSGTRRVTPLLIVSCQSRSIKVNVHSLKGRKCRLLEYLVRNGSACALRINPFNTAVPLWGQTTCNLSCSSPERGCGPKAVKPFCYGSTSSATTVSVPSFQS